MINAGSLNGESINGSSSRVVHWASAGWSAGATVEPIETYQKHAAKGSWEGALAVVFGPEKTQFGKTNWSSTSYLDSTTYVTFQGGMEVSASASFTAVPRVTRLVTANWSAGATGIWKPNPTLLNVGWLAGVLETDFAPTLKQASKASWLTESAFEGAAIVRAAGSGAWKGTASFLAAPSIKLAGETEWTHYSNLYLGVSAKWEIVSDLVALKIPLNLLGTSTITMSPYLVTALAASWEASSTWQAVAHRKFYTAAAFEAGATFEATATVIKYGDRHTWNATSSLQVKSQARFKSKGSWGASSSFTAASTVLHSTGGSWGAGAALQMTGGLSQRSMGNWSAAATITPILSSRKRGTAANWDAGPSVVFHGGIRIKSPAPAHRTFSVRERGNREFQTRAIGSRQFEVAA